MVDSVRLRLAVSDDLEFLSALAGDPAVEPHLAPGRGEPTALRELLSPRRPISPEGLYLIASSAGRPVGGLALAVINRRSRICELSRVMVHPDARGTGVALDAVRFVCRTALADQGFHRMEAQVYGDNVAGRRLFERAGFTREGTRRRAYWRHGGWLDGILYGLLTEEFERFEAPASSTGFPP